MGQTIQANTSLVDCFNWEIIKPEIIALEANWWPMFLEVKMVLKNELVKESSHENGSMAKTSRIY